MVNLNFTYFLKTVDKYVIPILLFIFLPFKKQSITNSKNKKVLYIRLWGLGDTICTLPTIEKLFKLGYSVDILTTRRVETLYNLFKKKKEVFIFNYTNPLSFLKLLWKLNNKKYSFLIDSEYFMNISSLLSLLIRAKKKIGFNHLLRRKVYTDTVLYNEKEHFVYNFNRELEPLNINFRAKNLCSFDEHKSKKIKDLLKQYNSFKLIGINIGTAETATGRRWSKNNFLSLTNLILEKYENVLIIFTGLKIEKTIFDKIKNKIVSHNYINLIEKLSIEEFLYLLKKIDLFISNDTGAMHMSANQSCKTIGLFGMTTPLNVGAFPLNKHYNIHKNPNNNPIINSKYSYYPKNKYSTVNLIKPEEVFEIVKKCLTLTKNKNINL